MRREREIAQSVKRRGVTGVLAAAGVLAPAAVFSHAGAAATVGAEGGCPPGMYRDHLVCASKNGPFSPGGFNARPGEQCLSVRSPLGLVRDTACA